MLHKLFSDECESLGPQPSPSQIKRCKVILPKRQNRRRQAWNDHRRSAHRHVLVLISLFFTLLVLSFYHLVFEKKPIKLRHKIRTTHAINQTPSRTTISHPFSFSLYFPSRARITLIETKPLPPGNHTLILSYIGLYSMCLHLLYSIPITGTPRSPLRYKTYNMLRQQVVRMPVYLRRPSYFLRGVESSTQVLSIILLFALPTPLFLIFYLLFRSG